MTAHLGLDDLTHLVDSTAEPTAGDHLPGCHLCRERLANLRARSSDVSAALAGAGDVGPMPAEVAARITAALSAQRRTQPRDAQPDGRPDDGHLDQLARARQRRSQRLRGWLVAAAVVVVVGTGFGAIQHFAVGTSDDTAATAGRAPAGDGSLPASGAAAAGAADGNLSTSGFASDAKAFVAAQSRPRPTTSSSRPLARPSSSAAATPRAAIGVPRPTSTLATAVGSARCGTTASTHAAAIAGPNAAAGSPVESSARLVGAVTVDGRPGVLYVVDVGPVEVAVAMANCSSGAPDVLAGATL